MTCLGLQTVETILISPVSEALKIDSPIRLDRLPQTFRQLPSVMDRIG